MDFGYTNDPTAFFIGFIDTDNEKLYAWDEVYQKGMSNKMIYNSIADAGYSKERITADSAEPKSIDELKTKLEVLRESWPELLDWTLENVENKELEEAWKHSDGDVDLDIIAEHLMVYFVFTYFCGAVYDEEAHSKMKFSVIGTLMVLETAKTLWAENPDAGKMAAVLEAAKRYSREVEHSDENIELLEKLSRREGVFGLDSMLTGILN